MVTLKLKFYSNSSFSNLCILHYFRGFWQMKEKVIFHIDANSFFASVEIAHNPELKGKPVAVAGNPEKRTGIILTKNHIAKSYGVETGEVIWQAKLKCPDLVCLPPHHDVYEEYSKKLRDIYEKYTDRVEGFGIDECWLDMTDSLKFFGNKIEVADRIRQEVKDTLGITVSVGISFCKLFAKLGSDMKKPDATTYIPYENFKEIIYPLPITTVIGIGKRLEKRYNQIGVFVLGDIVKIPDGVLKKKFGILGLNLKQTLLGFCTEEVKKFNDIAAPKSIGNGTTTPKDMYTKDEVYKTVNTLCEQVASRLREQNFVANSVSITIKTAEFKYYGNNARLTLATNTSSELASFCMTLLDEFWTYNQPIRAIRICSYNLKSASSSQLCMFSADIKIPPEKPNKLNSLPPDNSNKPLLNSKWRNNCNNNPLQLCINSKQIKNANLNNAVDKIRTKYGKNAINPLSDLL